MVTANPAFDHERSEQIDYWLRRAEQESIAAIRSVNDTASERHDAMALAYSALAVTLLGGQGAAAR